MKNYLLICAAVVLFGMTSCGDTCSTCSVQDPLFGLNISSEICDNGDGTITVTATALGITQDTTYTADYDAEIAAAIADGATCD